MIDIGAGTGATVRELFPKMHPPQDWTLVDTDAGLLKVAQRELSNINGLRVATHCADLTVAPLWSEPPHIVTASALFDLTSAAFVDRLAAALARDRVTFLAALTYDGRLELSPTHPFDDAMIDAFNRHQRQEKSFGRALGPDACDVLATALTRVGATVTQDESPWRLAGGKDMPLMQAMLDGWAVAAKEIMPDRVSEIDAWRQARRTLDSLFVGHRDHLATF